ncbi:MAG: RNA-guided endonuclease InsQ/TnpB family protein [Candidatus Hodarchaeota archaeon]
MLVHKTVKAKLHSLTKIKEDLISREYNAFQEAVKGKKEDVNLYSATKQQAKKKKIKFQKKPKKKEQPLRLRNDCFRIEKQEDTKISKFWIKIPVYNPEKDRGDSVWCPIVIPRKDEKLIEQCDFGDSELVKKGNDWFVHLVVKKEAEIQDTYNDVLAIDLGVKWIATSVALSDRKTNFYGKEIRKIRGHYFYLRKKLARKKIHQFYNRIKNSKEKDKINDKLHKISKKIIDDAKKRNALIVLGDLKGIRKQNKGRRFNRKLNSFSYHKLVQYIKYKANWEGIQVIKVSEAYTSQFCWRCGTKGVRHNGLFKCPSCGLLENSDRNGAINIGKRALGQVSFKSRGTTGSAQNPSSEQKDFKQGYSKRLGKLPPLEGRGCQGVILNY